MCVPTSWTRCPDASAQGGTKTPSGTVKSFPTLPVVPFMIAVLDKANVTCCIVVHIDGEYRVSPEHVGDGAKSVVMFKQKQAYHLCSTYSRNRAQT